MIGNLYAHQAAAYNHTAVAGIGRPGQHILAQDNIGILNTGIFF